ncbi:MAG: hypothetical protein OEW78_09895 [Nitrosopumilus sp.]|uniref:hypothetical protein n=1 Tax=Nitrosopumilus sp. TaxID=2024843 RepID=UPI00246CF44A|nr:hypothetical protein [Nitrosopumilus sp.]MDH5432171.1 hypothetical protein [Nitrosopumilus sp.]
MVFAESGFPIESLFYTPIIVLSPLSCIFNVNPGPVLAVSVVFETSLRSLALFSMFSEITHPQLEQTISPITSSVTNLDALQQLQNNFSFLITGVFGNRSVFLL